jgi:hypothetical protein
MKIHEVPQDQDPSYQGGKKICYAVDDQGKFVKTHTSGWTVEETVKGLAWKVIEEDLEKTMTLVKEGRLSLLNYYMKLRQMDSKLLAQNMGLSVWRVRWHLRPRVFKKLKEEWLQRYSDCLEVPVETLRMRERIG